MDESKTTDTTEKTQPSLEVRLANLRLLVKEGPALGFPFLKAVFGDDGATPDIELILATSNITADCLLHEMVWASEDKNRKDGKRIKSDLPPSGLFEGDNFERVMSALTHNLEKSGFPVQHLPHESLCKIYSRALEIGNPHNLDMGLHKRLLVDSVYDEKKHADPEHRANVMSSLPNVELVDLLYAICPLREEGSERESGSGSGSGSGSASPDLEVLDAVPAELAGKLFEKAMWMRDMAEQSEFGRSFFDGVFRHTSFWSFMSSLTHHLEKVQCPAKFLEEEYMEEIYTPARQEGNPHNLNLDLFKRVFLELGRIGEPMNPKKYDDIKHFVLSSCKELILENMETATVHDILYAFGPYAHEHADLELIDAMPLEKTLAMFKEAIKETQTDEVFKMMQTGDLVGALTDRLEELECPVELLDFDTIKDLYESDYWGGLNHSLYKRVLDTVLKANGGALIMEKLRERSYHTATQYLESLEDSDISMEVRAQIGQFFITFMRKEPRLAIMMDELQLDDWIP